MGDVLLVWAERSEEEYGEEQRKMLLRQFRRQTGCNAAEATYYLDSHSFQIGDAIREWRHDVQFERERALCVRSIREEDARLAAEASREAKRREAEEEATAAAAAARLSSTRAWPPRRTRGRPPPRRRRAHWPLPGVPRVKVAARARCAPPAPLACLCSTVTDRRIARRPPAKAKEGAASLVDPPALSLSALCVHFGVFMR